MWFWFALTFAFLSSINIFIYKLVLKKTDEYVTSWISAISVLPVLFLIVFHFYGFPKIDRFFLMGVFASAAFNVVAGLLSFRSIKISEISLLAPISAFNPLFTTIISFFTLKERFSLQGLLGVVLITFGAYLINLSSIKKGILAPIKSLFLEKGVILILICNLIWAITPTFEKTAILHTNPKTPPFASLVAGLFLSLLLFPIMLKKSPNPFRQIKDNLKFYVITGVIGGIAQAAGFITFSLSNVGYATAIFKLSMFFNILWGYLFLKEKEIKERLLGAGVMFVGILFLLL